MAVRTSMTALILSVRTLINDPPGGSETFTDQQIQDVMDEGRADYWNEPLKAKPTFSGSTISYLDYFHPLGGWEDDFVLKQYLTVLVTPSVSEPIVGHWTFAASTLPPIMITGKSHDRYRAAADLLERQSAQWMLSYGVSADGQTLNRQQVIDNIQKVIKLYRSKQRPHTITTVRSDLVSASSGDLTLAPTSIDFFASGNGS
jgi:hypothetical protein